jgi:hypothetical protein
VAAAAQEALEPAPPKEPPPPVQPPPPEELKVEEEVEAAMPPAPAATLPKAWNQRSTSWKRPKARR